MTHLPSYDNCLDIVSKTGKNKFYYNERYIDGFKIVIFNYFLPEYSDFLNYNSKELRGITFVFNIDGSLYKRYLLFRKFFTINQVPESLYSTIKDLKIKSIELKEDGSLISFIRLPNGKIIAKSKMEINNPQTEMAMSIYNSDNTIRELVNYLLDNELVGLFELVSPFNQVVVNYKQTELILLKIRNNTTGEYVELDDFDFKIKKSTPIFNETLDSLLELSKKIENIEGWVVTFEDNTMVKIKTLWYCQLHNLLDNKNREDYIIAMIINNTIDDFISLISVDDVEILNLIKKCQDVITSYFKKMTKLFDVELELFKTKYNCSLKEYSLVMHKHKYFPMFIQILRGHDQYEYLKSEIIRLTYFLKDAKYFIENEDLVN